jgi:hypothetical protein
MAAVSQVSPTQVSPTGQIAPHWPQFSASLAVSVQTLPQQVPVPPSDMPQVVPSLDTVQASAAHTAPCCTQTCPVAQPEPVQLATTPPVRQAGPLPVQSQCEPGGQACPHPPQSESSSKVQVPAQQVPTARPTTQGLPFASASQLDSVTQLKHSPSRQTPSPHDTPQAPQLEGSAW